jgi:hypothetical protein
MQEVSMEQKSSHVLRLAGITLGLALLVSLAVLVIGRFYQWNTTVQFSNGFFVAGAILIVLGVFSVAGGFGQRASFPLTYAESAGDASLTERAQRMMADINQRYGMMILLMGAGLLLIGISILIHRLF